MESAHKNETEQDYWEQQAATPLRKRGRGWWLEVGFSNIILVAVVIAAVAIFVLT